MQKLDNRVTSDAFLQEIEAPVSLQCLDTEPVMESLTPDILIDTGELESLSLNVQPEEDCGGAESSHAKSFLLMDGNEKLRINLDVFLKRLGCSADSRIKVVSIFGNTGDGKSHTMNHTFFDGEEVFKTSPEQNSCTLGVWAAYQPALAALCLDTEGLLGVTQNENQRTRMLLKVLAISDIIVYRTGSERLHSDMFRFLGTASRAFVRHFAAALQSLDLPGTAKSLGPAIVIFHETRNTKTLESTLEESAEDILRERFVSMQLDLEAFSSLKYVGIQSLGKQTDFSPLYNAIKAELDNTTVRSPRAPEVIFQAIKALNLKFSGEIRDAPLNPFPEQYFTCGIFCESCGERCERSMGHLSSGEGHRNSRRCRYQHQFENKVLLCKQCHTNGREVIVQVQSIQASDSTWLGIAKYAWSGSLIECPNCGEIYRSRQYWYGNKNPEDAAVRSEIVHVWKGAQPLNRGPNYSAQLVLDGVTYIADTVVSVSAQPTSKLKSWIADKVAPSYWRPNSEITNCRSCKVNFEQVGLYVHHCRSCGDGFCNACSKHSMPVPARGWEKPVRVCNGCRDELIRANGGEVPSQHTSSSSGNDETDIMVRKYGEAVISTLSTVASALEYPKGFIKDSARPSYWVPDAEAPSCVFCSMEFGTAEELNGTTPLVNGTERSPMRDVGASTRTVSDRKRHHCRACGQAVCNNCSLRRRPVPERGWTIDVRVCDSCILVTE